MDNHCVMCGAYLADTGRMVCEKCEKGEQNMAKPKKQQTTKCPKCKAKLVDGEWYQKCNRCGYSKKREPSNLTKRLFGF